MNSTQTMTGKTTGDAALLDMHGNALDDRKGSNTTWEELEDIVGRLQVRVTALERLWERVSALEKIVDGLSCR